MQVESIKVQDPSVQASCRRRKPPIVDVKERVPMEPFSAWPPFNRQRSDHVPYELPASQLPRGSGLKSGLVDPVHFGPVFREMSEDRDPGPSSDQFDALIELLASDDAHDDSNFHIAPEGMASSGVRDANGKLDYAKIRSLFLQRRASNDGNHAMHSDALNHDPNSESRLRPPLIVVEEPTAFVGDSLLPKPLSEREDIESSKIKAVSKDGNVHYSQSVLPPEASGDSIVHHLQAALCKAEEEVAQLRDQVSQLQTQAGELFESDFLQGSRDASDIRGYLTNTPRSAQAAQSNVQEAFAMGSSADSAPTKRDRSDVERAIQFVVRTDELVWRRSRYPNGCPAPVFSQSNLDALTERLTLWESIIRAPP